MAKEVGQPWGERLTDGSLEQVRSYQHVPLQIRIIIDELLYLRQEIAALKQPPQREEVNYETKA